jgi:hypothetical protein
MFQMNKCLSKKALEEALIDYVERYGLTEKARIALSTSSSRPPDVK